tara:strand:+ start:197 stop:1183 length:987 start_codon:yes stop_codon:yes gene_type:complete
MAWYMVHRHEATKAGLHWDLRLEENGVLKSWAIPKGMPKESGMRHLAIQTPDHDLEYGKWEGTIPEGSYGAGKVTIDATGEYKTIERTKNKWKFQCLTGKYKGTWTLRHWKNKQWLITKSADQKYSMSYSAEGESCDFCEDPINVTSCITDLEEWNPKNCGKLVCDECQVQLLTPVNPQSGKSYWVTGFCPICAQEEVSSGEMFNADAPLDGQTFEAPYEIKIYVPSTRLDTRISEAAFQNRIRVTKSFLSHLFGGYTSVQAQGGYLSNEGGVITEPVAVVTGFANPEDYEDKLPLLERFIKSKQKRWGQESLGFEFENDFFMYPDFV